MSERIVIAGASGVIGAAAVEAFAGSGFEVLALSRRRPILGVPVHFDHVAVDLTDEAQCKAMVAQLGGASHLLYAAVAEKPGLVDGWNDPEMIALNARMFANLARPLAESGGLAWTGLLQGTKAYGAHLHPIALPAREDRPRDNHANFYFEQEDFLRSLASTHGFSWTVLRPQVVFGGAPGAVMNPVVAIGVYAAICHQLGLPFAYPGRERVIWEVTDASLLADALLWAARTPAAHGETYNVTNGDVFVLRDAWQEVADAMGIEASFDVADSLAKFLSREDSISAWRRLARDNGLLIDDLKALIGQSHHYVDMLISDQMVAPGRLPAMVSTIKIRQAGFGECRDSLRSLFAWLDRMRDARLLPRVPA